MPAVEGPRPGRGSLVACHDEPAGAAVRGRQVIRHDARVCNWRDGHIQLHSLDTDLSVAQTYIGAARAWKPLQATQYTLLEGYI